MPFYAFIFMIFTMANVGLPGTTGFIGEVLTLAAMFQVSTWMAFFATTGVILSAGYALWLYRRVIFGELEKESLRDILDMDKREKYILVPMIVITIFFGLYPKPIFNVTSVSVDNLIENYQQDMERAGKMSHEPHVKPSDNAATTTH